MVRGRGPTPDGRLFSLEDRDGKNSSSPLKIGVIAKPRFGSRYVHEFIAWTHEQDHLQATHLVFEQDTDTEPGNTPSLGLAPAAKRPIRALQKTFLNVLTAVEHVLLRGYPEHKDHLGIFDLERQVANVLYVTPRFSEEGQIYQYSEQDVQQIKNLRLDLLIKFSPGLLHGDIANAARRGTITLRHHDERTNRNGPPGFWEVYARQVTTGFTIQRITKDPRYGETLRRGHSWTQSFYLLNQAFLFKKMNYHLMEVVSEIAGSGTPRKLKEPQPYYNRLYTYPSLSVQLAYVSKTIALFVKKLLKRWLANRTPEWSVGFCRNDWPDVKMCQGQRLESARNCYLADPFVVKHGDRDVCFVEEYDCSARKGHIAAFEITDDKSSRLGRVINEEFHISFPYVFRFGGDLYMCPETSRNKEIRLYKCDKFPLQWTLSEVLMDNVTAVDSMIFEKGGTWWLLTNISDPPDLEDFSCQLCIFYADNPLSKSWLPHPKNPIVIDALKGRNAGLLTDKETVYRVAQKHGFDVYGEAFSINEICVLNKQDYVERELCSVEPNFFPRLNRTHHMHSNNSVTVFDFGLGSFARILDSLRSKNSSLFQVPSRQRTYGGNIRFFGRDHGVDSTRFDTSQRSPAKRFNTSKE